MPVSKETKNTAYLIEAGIGIFSILTGRWNLLIIDAAAAIITNVLPLSRKTEEK